MLGHLIVLGCLMVVPPEPLLALPTPPVGPGNEYHYSVALIGGLTRLPGSGFAALCIGTANDGRKHEIDGARFT